MSIFKRNRPALDAFESCQNKALQAFVGYSRRLEVVCPQFPFGSKEIATEVPSYIGEDDRREGLARKLGCATCKFRDETMERVDTQRISPDGVIEVEIRFENKNVPTVQALAE